MNSAYVVLSATKTDDDGEWSDESVECAPKTARLGDEGWVERCMRTDCRLANRYCSVCPVQCDQCVVFGLQSHSRALADPAELNAAYGNEAAERGQEHSGR